MLKSLLLNKYIQILIVSVFVILVAVQAGKSFVLDEIDFPAVSHAASQSYKPIYYRGEVQAHDVGNYHPTLYINSLALFIRVFGYNETSVRFFGVLCTLVSAFLLILILRLIIKRNDSAESLFLGLFLLNPYTIANTTLPDIDSTILPVVLLLFIYFSIRYVLQKTDVGNRAVLILGLLFGLALWAKLTTPLIIPVFLFCLGVIAFKEYKRSLLLTLKVTLIGALAFIVTYLAYCKLVGLSFSYTFRFLVDSFTKGTSSGGVLSSISTNIGYSRNFIYWITVPILGLFGISLIGVILDKDKTEETRVKKLLVVTGLLVTIFYIALIAPFGGFFKYPFPAFGLLMLTIVLFYDRYFRNIKIAWFYGLIALLAGFIAEKIFWKDSMFANGRPFQGVIILLLAIAAGYIWLKTDPRKIAASLFILIMLLAIGFQLSISRVQAISPYPTKYDYGQMGFNQTVGYLKSNTRSNEAIWSMKDTGYYVNNKYYESYSYFFDDALQGNLINMLKKGKVRYYVVSTGIGQDNIDYYANIKKILDTYAVQDKQFGNFIIYKSKAAQ